MKRTRWLTLISSICFILVLFVPVWAESPGKPSGELRIGMPTLLTETLHPYRAPPARKFYTELMYDYLVGINEKMELDPALGIAYKWEEAPDHMSWTYYIRDGVTFHDGTPVTLEDIKYSMETVMDEKNTVGPWVFKPFVKGFEVVPPNKLVVHMIKPWILMPYYVSPVGEGVGVILPKKYLEEKGIEYFENHPIGTGPYKFLEKKEGNYIKFVAQDSHWRVGTPKYRHMTFKLMPEEGTRAAALQKGEVDIILVSISRAAELERAGFPIREKIGDADLTLVFQRMYDPNNPLSKKKVRQALVYAIDKASIWKHVLQGRGRLIGHTVYLYTTSICYKDYPLTPYDPKKAKQLLAEAGYPNGFKLYFYSVETTLPEQKLVNEAIADYWRAIGMDVTILEMDYGALRPIWRKAKDPAGPAVHTFVWPSKPTGTWYGIFHSDIKKYPFSQTQDPEMDRLMDEFNAQLTMEGYCAAERKCVERVLSQYYNSGIASIGALFATGKDVPEWDPGHNTYAYRFEYVGARK